MKKIYLKKNISAFEVTSWKTFTFYPSQSSFKFNFSRFKL